MRLQDRDDEDINTVALCSPCDDTDVGCTTTLPLLPLINLNNHSVLPACLDYAYFPAIIGKLRRDVTDDKEVLRGWNFPFIRRTVDSDSGWFSERHSFVMQTVVRIKQHVVGLSSLRSQLCFKKQTSSRRNTAGFEKTYFDCDPDQRRWQLWVILVLKSR